MLCTSCWSKKGDPVANPKTRPMSATHPGLAAELHPIKNANLTYYGNSIEAKELVAGTMKRLWWKCSKITSQGLCGHEWTASGADRSHKHRPTGCPACATTGFDPSKPGQYYVIAILSSGDTIMYKAGISNNYLNRIIQHERNFRAHDRSKEWELELCEVLHHTSGQDSQKLESLLLQKEEIRAPDIEGLSSELFTSNPLDLAREIGLV